MHSENGKRPSREVFGIVAAIAGIAIATTVYLALGGAKPRQQAQAASSGGFCDAMPSALASMKDKLVVEAYVTPSDAEMTAFAERLKKILGELAARGGGKVDAKVVLVKDDALRAKLIDDGALEQLRAAAAPSAGESASEEAMAEVVPTKAVSAVFMRYGKEKGALPYLDPSMPEGIEFWLTNEIRKIVTKGDARALSVGVLAGDDAIGLADKNLVPSGMGGVSLTAVAAQNFPYFALRDVDLAHGDKPIDDALGGLLITQPGRDLDEKELRRIDDFVMKGKPLAVFAGAVNIAAGDSRMHATLAMRGLDRLLAAYGVEVRSDVLLDFGRAFLLRVPGAGTMRSVAFPIVPIARGDAEGKDDAWLDAKTPPFLGIDELAFPFASSLALHADKQPAAKLRVLARTSTNTLRRTSAEIDLAPLQQWTREGEQGQWDVVAVVEGTLTSAFDGNVKSAKPTRVLVVASSQFFANPFARAANTPGGDPTAGLPQPATDDQQLRPISTQYAQRQLTATVLVFKNTLDWLTPNDAFSACTAVLSSGAPSSHAKPREGPPRMPPMGSTPRTH